MSSQKKRKNDESVEVLSPTSMSTAQRSRRAATRKMPRQANNDFLKMKLSLWQQAVEQANISLQNIVKSRGDNDGFIFLPVADHLRNMDDIDHLYGCLGKQVLSMGQDDCQQLGISGGDNADSEEEKRPVYPPTILRNVAEHKFIQVAAGGLHSLALTDDGKVFSWGTNDDGALGRETNDDVETATPTLIDKGILEKDKSQIVMIRAGDSHSLFLSISGNVYMCGMYKDTDSGKFRDMPEGNTNVKGSHTCPVHVNRIKQTVKYIACGHSFNAAILADDTMVTWGMGHFGQLARSADMTNLTIDEETKKPTYAIGKPFITETFYNQKIGEEDLRYIPEKISELFLTPLPPHWAGGGRKKKVLSVACGGQHMLVCARDMGVFGSKIYSAGLNQYGQLGHGDQDNRHELTPIKNLEDKNIIKAAAGEHFSLALNLMGTELYSFGRSDYGQLGLFNDIQDAGSFEATPTRMAFPEPDVVGKVLLFSDIDAGDRHGMAITREGEVYSWGYGETGANGQKTLNDVDCPRPRKLDVLWNYDESQRSSQQCVVRQVSGGGQHSLMIID